MKIEGAREFSRLLGELPSALSQAALRNAGMKAAKPLQEEMQRNAPVGTRTHKTRGGTVLKPGFGRASVKRWVIAVTPTNVKIGVGIPGKGMAAQAWYMRLQEFGTRFFPAHPWARPAVGAKWREVVDAAGVELGKQIMTQAKKLAGKYGRVRKQLLKS